MLRRWKTFSVFLVTVLSLTLTSVYLIMTSDSHILIDYKTHVFANFSEEDESEIKCEIEKKKLIGNFHGKTDNEEYLYYERNECKSWRRCELQLEGRKTVDFSSATMESLWEDERLHGVKHGGWYTPNNCKSQRHVAIVIPFRNRENHLPIFLRHIHPILQRQSLHYRIFVIDQVDEETFNRGKLLNVGFNESQKFFPYDCVVFHDVDLLSEDDRNTFDCSTSPQHMCASLDKFNYKLPYVNLFGGVEMFTREHFQLINGFSNSFWGWGAEDDNLYSRLVWKHLKLWRPPAFLSAYRMIKHADEKPHADMKRYDVLRKSRKHLATDGLINLQYEIIEIKEHKLYTRIKVNLRKDKDKMFGVKDFPS